MNLLIRILTRCNDNANFLVKKFLISKRFLRFPQVNAISLTAIGTMNFLITHAPVVLLYLNCKILEERIIHTSRRLHRFSFGNRFNSSKVDRYLHDLATIFDEVQRSNFFWSKYLGMNYFIAIAICCIVFLCSKFYDSSKSS